MSYLSQYLDFAALKAELLALKKSYPQHIHTEIISIGSSPQGRDILALCVSPQGHLVQQPTLWVDANMHSAELIGTNVVLAQINHLASLLADKKTHDEAAARNYIFVPRVCPDGAESYFTDARVNRSNARDSRASEQLGSHWQRTSLVDKMPRPGTRLAVFKNPHRLGVMRRSNEAGVWATDALHPQCIRRREIGDVGPFYDILPEGIIENFDGVNIPPARCVDANEIDLNRNFPIFWKADHAKTKSGAHPLSQPESQALVTFSSSKPEIYFWLNYHTFGGVFIRPPEHEPDSKLPRLDASIFELVDRDLERLTGYPAVAGAAEFLYEPGVPLPGTLTDWAYYGLGAYAYVCELWDLPARLGHTQRPFIKRYTTWTAADWRALFRYDQGQNEGLLFGHPWIPFEHPQLGPVEISELPSVFGIQNPPESLIAEVVKPQIAVFEHAMRMAPQPKVKAVVSPSLHTTPGDLSLRVEVSNQGFLPTHISEQKNLTAGVQQIIIRLSAFENVRLAAGVSPVILVCDLDGFAPLNTGWLDFAGYGTQSATARHVDFALVHLNPLVPARLSIEVVFPRAGTLRESVLISPPA